MRIEKPKTLSEFLELFEKYHNSGNSYYRGQAVYSWEIIPGIARNKAVKNFTLLTEIENMLISNFRKTLKDKNLKKLIPVVKGSYHETWILLMAAQHYGLPTRLLDFSNDKMPALEFAITNVQYLNNDGAFIIYENISSINEGPDSPILSESFKSTHHTFFFQVPSFKGSELEDRSLSEKRKLIQGSKFLYRDTKNLHKCLSLDKDHTDKLVVIHIPSLLKQQIVDHFMKSNSLTFDPFAGKNAIDYYAAILKNEFLRLNDSNIGNYLK